MSLEMAVLGGLATLLLVDLALVSRRPHEPSTRESAWWVAGYAGLALAVSALLLVVRGPAPAGQLLAGWLTEYSLSVDNLFVFVIIMSRFAVPRDLQQRVLMIGILLSLVLRGGCILLGAAAIERFSWVFYLFGLFLIYTAVGLLRHGEDHEDDFNENVVIRAVRRALPVTEDYEAGRLVLRRGRRWFVTPLMIVLIAIGTTDLLFAFDSIPAIFGLTTDPFLVFTATLLALMGLRQLYFLLGTLLQRLRYLSVGLAVILAFIGVKLVMEALHTNQLAWINGGDPVHWAPVVPTWVSLSVVVVVLMTTAIASLLRSRHLQQVAAVPAVVPARVPASGPHSR
jgi:tellurite resistance protein TerC